MKMCVSELEGGGGGGQLPYKHNFFYCEVKGWGWRVGLGSDAGGILIMNKKNALSKTIS